MNLIDFMPAISVGLFVMVLAFGCYVQSAKVRRPRSQRWRGEIKDKRSHWLNVNTRWQG